MLSDVETVAYLFVGLIYFLMYAVIGILLWIIRKVDGG